MKQRNVLDWFMGAGQKAAIRHALRGEEKNWFQAKLQELQTLVDGMPITGETDGQGPDAVVHLHYFGGSCDAWITELDMGCLDDEPDQYQSQAFGRVDLGWGGELGYVSIPELLAAGMELDMHWQPITLKEVKNQ